MNLPVYSSHNSALSLWQSALHSVLSQKPEQQDSVHSGIGITAQVPEIRATALLADQFDTDAGESATVMFAPGLTQRLLKCCADDTVAGVQLEGGNRYDAVFANEITRVLPRGIPFSAVMASAVIARAERATRFGQT